MIWIVNAYLNRNDFLYQIAMAEEKNKGDIKV